MAEPSVYDTVRNLNPGDPVEVVHEVKVGFRRWSTTTRGTVVCVERRRHGLHYARNSDDKVFSDVLVLQLEGGEQTTLAIDEFTRVELLEGTAGDNRSGRHP